MRLDQKELDIKSTMEKGCSVGSLFLNEEFGFWTSVIGHSYSKLKLRFKYFIFQAAFDIDGDLIWGSKEGDNCTTAKGTLVECSRKLTHACFVPCKIFQVRYFLHTN